MRIAHTQVGITIHFLLNQENVLCTYHQVEYVSKDKSIDKSLFINSSSSVDEIFLFLYKIRIQFLSPARQTRKNDFRLMNILALADSHKRDTILNFNLISRSLTREILLYSRE